MKHIITTILLLCALSLLPEGGVRPPSVVITASPEEVRASPPDCDTPYPEAGCAPTSALIKLSTTTDGFTTKKLSFKYTVTRGEVVGRGSDVTWDLTGLHPSVYEVRVEVEDGRGGRAAGSKKVAVTRCACPQVSRPPR